MCIYSLTDYMLLVSVIETFIATVTEGSPLGIAGVGPVAHEKNDCQRAIYACRTTVYHLLI